MSNSILSLKVRLLPDLSAKALKTDQDSILAIWHLLRALNVTGCGHIDSVMAKEDIQQLTGYTRRHINRLFSRGEDKLWVTYESKRGSRIQIYGLKDVCLYFDTPLMQSPRFYDVPLDRFNKLRIWRLRMWESLHKPASIKASPISRAYLGQFTGVSERCQRYYDNDSDIKKTVNFRPHEPECKRLPNSYHRNDDSGGHVGMVRKVRKQLRSLLSDEALSKDSLKRYFSAKAQLLKDKKHTDWCYVLIRGSRRQIKGRLEWIAVDTTL